jgi:hypothetical protein
MIAARGFKQAVANIKQGQSLEPTLGEYLPQIAYCTTARFEKSGANGCLGPLKSKKRDRR